MIKFWKRTNRRDGRDQQLAGQKQVSSTVRCDPRDVDEYIQREVSKLARDQAPGRYRVRVRRKVASV